DETYALAHDGPDQALLVAAVADRLAGGVDTARQRRIGNDPPAPDRLDQVVLARHAIAGLHPIEQEIRHLGLDRHPPRAPPKLAPVDVKHMIFKEKSHAGVPQPCASPQRSPSQGRIKRTSRTNQVYRKVLASVRRHKAAHFSRATAPIAISWRGLMTSTGDP